MFSGADLDPWDDICKNDAPFPDDCGDIDDDNLSALEICCRCTGSPEDVTEEIPDFGRAQAEGAILVREPGPYRFDFDLIGGEVQFELNGEVVLEFKSLREKRTQMSMISDLYFGLVDMKIVVKSDPFTEMTRFVFSYSGPDTGFEKVEMLDEFRTGYEIIPPLFENTGVLEVEENTPLPDGATYFIVVPFDDDGNEVFDNRGVYPIRDLVIPFVGNVRINDTSPFCGRVGGWVVITPRGNGNVTHYNLYYGTSASAKLPAFGVFTDDESKAFIGSVDVSTEGGDVSFAIETLELADFLDTDPWVLVFAATANGEASRSFDVSLSESDLCVTTTTPTTGTWTGPLYTTFQAPMVFTVADGNTFEDVYMGRSGQAVQDAFCSAMMDTLESSRFDLRPLACDILSADIALLYDSNLTGEDMIPATVSIEFSITFDSEELFVRDAGWSDIRETVEFARTEYVDDVNTRLVAVAIELGIEGSFFEVLDLVSVAENATVFQHSGGTVSQIPPMFSTSIEDQTSMASVVIIMVVVICICCCCCTSRLIFVLLGKRRNDDKIGEDGDAHVAWEANLKALKVRIGKDPPSDLRKFEEVKDELRQTEAEMAVALDIQRIRTWIGEVLFADTESIEIDAGGRAKKYMETNQVCEYFSRSMNRWLFGKIYATEHVRTKVECSAVLALGEKQQKRVSVGLGEVRLPLEDGELVEVISIASNGKDIVWLPGTVEGRSRGIDGATVRLDGGGLMKRMYSVRRRFLEGSFVAVYKGPVQGWVDAVIDSSGLPGDISKVKEMEVLALKVGDLLSTGQCQDPATGAANRDSHWSAIQRIWTLVPVRVLFEQEVHLVPSFLVRNEATAEI